MNLESQIILTLVAFGTSALSGAIGMGGGISLLAVMASFFPPAALIPIHGVVQFGSNITRVFFNIKSLDKKLLSQFFIGSLMGALLASQFQITLPESFSKLIIGLFVLTVTWAPKIVLPKKLPSIKRPFALLGLIATLISLFIGATGPFIAPFFLNKKLGRQSIVASKAACQLIAHTFKIFIFSLWGFSFAPHVQIIVFMLIAVALGSYTGKIFLNKFSERTFTWIFKALLTVISLRLIALHLLG